MKAMTAYMGNTNATLRQYQKNRRNSFRNLRKGNVLRFKEKPISHIKNEITPTKKGVLYTATTASLGEAEAGPSATSGR